MRLGQNTRQAQERANKILIHPIAKKALDNKPKTYPIQCLIPKALTSESKQIYEWNIIENL